MSARKKQKQIIQRFRKYLEEERVCRDIDINARTAELEGLVDELEALSNEKEEDAIGKVVKCLTVGRVVHDAVVYLLEKGRRDE